ncbi:Adenosine/AMP deaminase [Madurella fahalii]|uniref:Adenosine/AMP deaminase n=1 Tax=Madurella fahalii TaxID=1157608 RepID=A0ABQ0GP57_9PEZI
MASTEYQQDTATVNIFAQEVRQSAYSSPAAPPAQANRIPDIKTADEYLVRRAEILRQEEILGFEWACKQKADENEILVNAIIQALRRRDEALVYGEAARRQGYAGQLHGRFSGDHFLSNVDLIEKTAVFRVARQMPKGAHLHTHFNTNLSPDYLLGIAKGMERMCISSDRALLSEADYDTCKIRFLIRSEAEEERDRREKSLFSEEYPAQGWMGFGRFLAEFHRHYLGMSAEQWLQHKLVFHEEEVHNLLQTADGAWEKFNGRTQMMKGLFNYETAYRKYTASCLQGFLDDNIQYAEIRVNFMHTNQVLLDNGSGLIGNESIVRLIIQECQKFQADSADPFGGLKIIYCTPRSFSPEKVKEALDECLRFKLRYPDYIAGFDLVGEESKGRPLKDFAEQLLEFQDECRAARVDVPFLFHCGETLDIGTDVDRNLVDALLLGAKRISHAFALSWHPHITKQMKERGICVELCPISNQILGLTPRMGGHSMYGLLADNVHCTVNSDNGTLFRSTLSHDFYQAMIGKADMTVHGWRQLVEWSLEHACMDEAERVQIFTSWERRWKDWLKWVIEEYGDVLPAQ